MAGSLFQLDDDLFGLLECLCEGVLSEEDGRRLAQRIGGDPASMDAYVLYMSLNANLGDRFSDRSVALDPSVLGGGDISLYQPLPEDILEELEVPPHGFGEIGQQLTPPSATAAAGSGQRTSLTPAGKPGPRPGSRIAMLVIGTAVAAMLLLYIGRGMLLLGPAHLPVAAQAPDAPSLPSRSDVPSATFVSGTDCLWGAPAKAVADGASLQVGEKFELSKGLARLAFAGGATVLVEGPAAFEVLGSNMVRMTRGSLAVRASGKTKDFKVVSPNATIVDLGTSFGVRLDPNGATEVEVFEGAVEVRPDATQSPAEVFGVGTAVRIQGKDGDASVRKISLSDGQFSLLLKNLWRDISPVDQQSTPAATGSGNGVYANFSGGQIPGTTGSFYGSVQGNGWRTPWFSSGNPLANIISDQPFSAAEHHYLRMTFEDSHFRTIAREYGACGSFDPAQPHVISWSWRYEGDLRTFSQSFENRAHFFGHPYFSRGTNIDSTWILGVWGNNEEEPLTEREQLRGLTLQSKRKKIAKTGLRKVHEMHWFAFDGSRGTEFDKSNMVDTGMRLKSGVDYDCTLVIYPQDARYDVMLSDGELSFSTTGLKFRNQDAADANVVHFGISTEKQSSPASFALDSICIQQLTSDAMPEELKPPDPLLLD